MDDRSSRNRQAWDVAARKYVEEDDVLLAEAAAAASGDLPNSISILAAKV